MLIAHISDTHLGFTQYGIEERENDFYESFEEAVDIMIKEHVDLVIHSGDIFDIPRPSGTALVKLLEQLKRLEDHNIRFLFILGEHDRSRLRALPVAKLYDEIKLATYLHKNTVKINNISITGYDKYRLHEIHVLKDQLSRLDIEGKKILVLHQGLKEFHEYAGELTHDDLPSNFDYYAFGHLHNKNKKWFDNFKGPVCYAGSTEVTRFDPKEDLEKGFYIVDLSREADVSWIKLDTRKHITLDINNENIDDLIARLDGKPIVKARFSNMDMAKIRSIMSILKDYALYIIPEYIRELKIGDIEKPRSIEEEMLKHAESILGSKDKADFAIRELLQLLLDNKEEAAELLWSAYKSNRFG